MGCKPLDATGTWHFVRKFSLRMNQSCTWDSPNCRLFFWRLAGGVGSGNSTVKHAREVGHLYQSEVFKKSFGCNYERFITF